MSASLANLSVWLVGAAHGANAKQEIPKSVFAGSIAITSVLNTVWTLNPKVTRYELPLLLTLSFGVSTSMFCLGSFAGKALSLANKN
jgi:hypothetical protein